MCHYWRLGGLSFAKKDRTLSALGNWADVSEEERKKERCPLSAPSAWYIDMLMCDARASRHTKPHTLASAIWRIQNPSLVRKQGVSDVWNDA